MSTDALPGRCRAAILPGVERVGMRLEWVCTAWVCTAAVCAVCAATASADVRLYRGPHPYDLQGHWHAEAGLHEHDTLPVGLDAFADLDGVLVFLGDPVAFGFTGDVWAFAGPHPIPFAEAYCGLRERHQHAFPPEGAFRRETDGSYRFVGALRGGLAMLRPRRTEPPQPVASA
ncbi:MAG: hypothetical protein K8H88_04135, partial [Sandaracinaceae bacterium]|nr:hypothetical protein [Sandaracinaceae bacterium]